MSLHSLCFNTLRPRQNGRHFADDMFKCIFFNENVLIPIEISLKFVPKGSINNNPTLFQILAWRRPGDKPLSEPMMVSSLTHICVTRPQWVKREQPTLSCMTRTWTCNNYDSTWWIVSSMATQYPAFGVYCYNIAMVLFLYRWRPGIIMGLVSYPNNIF